MSLEPAVGRSVVEAGSASASSVARRGGPRVDVGACCVLLGTGTVGRALLQRWDAFAAAVPFAPPRLVAVANSRFHVRAPEPAHAAGLAARLADANTTAAGFDPAAVLGTHGARIVIDATASDAVAARHANWLARGIHVVTACKLGQGGALARWRAIRAAAAHGSASYGDAATVGAGLPLLPTLRRMVAGGDRVTSIAGLLSGSLGWLFARFDGARPFSALLREARALGYTEPDPREDLCGADVRRKLLILARAAGFELEADAVEVESLVPDGPDATRGGFDVLDSMLRQRLDRARGDGRRLRYVARFDSSGARVGLEALASADPLAHADGCDNRVVIHSDRYRERPLLIEGPGAGADVTAAALCDDIAAILARAR